MKKIKITLLSIAIITALSTTSFAYIDPSVMTYIIQAVAGIIIAVGAAVTIYWRKAKKKVNKVLNIDENAKKEVEEEIIIFDDKNK